MNILLPRVIGAFIVGGQIGHESTRIDLGLIDEDTAKEMKDELQAAIDRLDNVFGLTSTEKVELMIANRKLSEIRTRLEPVAATESWNDMMDDQTDGTVYIDDLAGGNQDDAYYGGCEQGRVGMARDLLAEFFPEPD